MKRGWRCTAASRIRLQIASGRRFILAFAVGSAMSSAYGFLSAAWLFGIVEAIWTLVALRRWWTTASD